MNSSAVGSRDDTINNTKCSINSTATENWFDFRSIHRTCVLVVRAAVVAHIILRGTGTSLDPE